MKKDALRHIPEKVLNSEIIRISYKLPNRTNSLQWKKNQSRLEDRDMYIISVDHERK